MERYNGEYEVNPQFIIKLTTEKGKLIALLPTGEKINVCAETERDFYVTGQFLNIHFIEDKQGNITGFKLQQYYGETFVKKIK